MADDMVQKWRNFNIDEVELLRRHRLNERMVKVTIGALMLTMAALFGGLVAVLVLRQAAVGIWLFVTTIPCFSVLVVTVFIWLGLKNKEDELVVAQLELYRRYRECEWWSLGQQTSAPRWSAKEKWYNDDHFYMMVAQKGASVELLDYLQNEAWEEPLKDRP